jgi:selenocysteine-specific elongation factor
MAGDRQAHLTLGTAGHVDHGKTALVEALTGVNTDRLAEERQRGLSIELGFAELRLDEARSLSIVDVPGHERLIRTMVAGATGLDMFLMVVAADEGVMPQTREHLAVLDALGVRHGVVALTKCDRADDEARLLARDAVRALLPTAPVVEVSAVSGSGLGRLRETLLSATATIEDELAVPRDEPGHALLHVDRSFSLRGIGTVVTGTLWSGRVAPGHLVRIMPRNVQARVRGVQVHNRKVETGLAGQRVALNLSGVARTDVGRGDTVVSAGSSLHATYRLDVELRSRATRIQGERVQVHHGTRATPARVVDLGGSLAQLRLEAPLVARSGDRLVLRRIAPVETIGGGRVLDPGPPRHGPAVAVRERLERIGERGLDRVMADERRQQRSAEEVRARQGERHGKATPRESLDPHAKLVLVLLEAGGKTPEAPRTLAERLGWEPKKTVAMLDRLVVAGHAVRVSRDVYYAVGPLQELRGQALSLARGRGEITLPELRDALGTSRKYAQALLEHLDATDATVRHGDRHVLRPGPD